VGTLARELTFDEVEHKAGWTFSGPDEYVRVNGVDAVDVEGAGEDDYAIEVGLTVGLPPHEKRHAATVGDEIERRLRAAFDWQALTVAAPVYVDS